MKITPLVKLCILAAVGCGLYALWHQGVSRHNDEPEAAGSPGVAEFDAGFVYGLAFGRAIDDARIAVDRVRRGRVLKFVKKDDNT